jgi:hypothetical protein
VQICHIYSVTETAKEKSKEKEKKNFGTGWWRELVPKVKQQKKINRKIIKTSLVPVGVVNRYQRSPFVPVGGSNRYQRSLSQFLLPRGHQIDNFTRKPPQLPCANVSPSPLSKLCCHRRSRATVSPSPQPCRHHRRPQRHALHSVTIAHRSPTLATR